MGVRSGVLCATSSEPLSGGDIGACGGHPVFPAGRCSRLFPLERDAARCRWTALDDPQPSTCPTVRTAGTAALSVALVRRGRIVLLILPHETSLVYLSRRPRACLARRDGRRSRPRRT